MKTAIIIIGSALVIFIVAVALACCKVSSIQSRMEEEEK